MKRNPTRTVRVGSVFLGSGHPVAVQSMCATQDPGRGRHRRAGRGHPRAPGAPSSASPWTARRTWRPSAEVRRQTKANLVVDLQENYRLAESVAPHVDKVRYNPGHLWHHEKAKPVREKVALPRGRGAGERPRPPHRGQLRQRRPRDEGAPPRATTSRPWWSPPSSTAGYMDDLGFDRYVVSLKDSHPRKVIEANRRFAEARPDVPLHLGVTEAGIPPEGVIKTRVAFEQLLSRGIGDTLRVSLTLPNPRKHEEVDGRPADPGRHRRRPLPLGARLRRRQAQHHLLPLVLAGGERAVRRARGEGEGDDGLRGEARPDHRGHGLPRERPRRDRRRGPGPVVRPDPRQPEEEDRVARGLHLRRDPRPPPAGAGRARSRPGPRAASRGWRASDVSAGGRGACRPTRGRPRPSASPAP